MKLFVDLETRRFVVSPGVRSEPKGTELKRGDAASVEIVFCRGAEEVQLEASSEVIWELKKEGDYSGDPLIRAENMGYADGVYSGTAASDSSAIDAEFSGDAEFFAGMMEVTWKEPSAAGWSSTNTASVSVHNDVIKEDEELPALLLGGVPGEVASASLVFSGSDAEIVNQTGSLDLDGWEVNFHCTSGTGSPGSGALLSFGAGIDWDGFIPTIAEVINTGASTNPGVTVSGDPGAHPTISASVSYDSNSYSVLELTAETAGVAGNSRTYNFDDSEDTYDASGTLSGGVDPRNVLISDLVPTFEPQTALTSGEKAQARTNIEAAPLDLIETSMAPQTLTDAPTIDYDISLGRNAEVTLTADRTLSFITNPFVGASGALIVKQDATGGHSLTLDSSWFVSAGNVSDFAGLSANQKIQITWYCVDLYSLNATVLLLQ